VQSITDATMAMLRSIGGPQHPRLENLIERLVAVGEKEYIRKRTYRSIFHFAHWIRKGADRQLV